MKSIANFILIIFGIPLIISCNKSSNCSKDSHNTILIWNLSSQSVYISSLYVDSLKIELIKEDEIHGKTNFHYNIRGGTCWEEVFSDNANLYIFFLNPDTVKTLGEEKIIETSRGVLKRKEINLDYLKRNNFTIIYP
jgi:hypothetical protein